MTNFKDAFQVRTRKLYILASMFIGLGGPALGLMILSDFQPAVFCSATALMLLGSYFIWAARNVREIVVDDNAITFLPAEARLAFSDIKTIHIPSWARRWDKLPNTIGAIRLETKSDHYTWVPGAFVQLGGHCRLTLNVREDKVLMEHIVSRAEQAEVICI